MAIMNLPRPIGTVIGYGPTNRLPVTGGTPLTATAQQINDSPAVFNQWLHAQPWYVETMRAWGQDPNDPHLSPTQRNQLSEAASRAGVDTGGGNGAFGIDSNGNFEDVGMPTWTKAALIGFGGMAGAAALAPVIAGAGAGAGVGGATGSAYGPLAGGYAGLGTAGATSAAVPTALAAGGGGMGTVGSILSGLGGTGPYSWVAPVVNTGLNLYGQNKAQNANQSALDQQLAATKYATDAQSKSAAEVLAFNRQQAAYDASVAEGTRSGNYDQWAAKQRQLGTVGQALGLPARDIPAYVPLPAYGASVPGAAGPAAGLVGTDPIPGSIPMPGGGNGFDASGNWHQGPGVQPQGGPLGGYRGGAATAAPPAGAAASGGLPNIQGGDIAQQVRDYFQSRGVTPNDSSAAYWAQKWNEFGSRDPQYFNMRLSQADEFGGGGAAPGAAAASAQRYQPLTTVGQSFADAAAGIGQLQMPRYRPLSAGTVGSYLT